MYSSSSCEWLGSLCDCLFERGDGMRGVVSEMILAGWLAGWIDGWMAGWMNE